MRTSPLCRVPLLFLFCAFITASPAAATRYISHLKGQGFEAFFEATDPSGCVVTKVGVWGDGSRNPPRHDGVVQVSLYQFDHCHGDETLLSAFGFGFASPDELGLPNGSLGSAWMKTTVTDVHDEVSDEILTVSIDVSWVANGPVDRLSQTYRSQGPGYMSLARYTGNRRPAIAQGVVTYGAGNLTPSPTDDAQIRETQQGTLIFERSSAQVP